MVQTSLSPATVNLSPTTVTLHSDVATNDPAWAQRIHALRGQQGAIAGPMEVWLAHRSPATLELRLERQCKNALEIAGLLATRPEVKLVRYPGRLQDPAHSLATRQMKLSGPIVSFLLEGEAQAERFLAACNLVLQATSFGGVHTTAERRARWGGDTIPAGFIRLSASCEDTQDLLDNIAQALAAVGDM
jgi:cystathionine gamma-lyase